MSDIVGVRRYVCAGEGERVFTIAEVNGAYAMLRREDGHLHGWEALENLQLVEQHIAELRAAFEGSARRLRGGQPVRPACESAGAACVSSAMRNITMTEWRQEVAQVLSEAQSRVPWLQPRARSFSAVTLENNVMSCSLTLTSVDGEFMIADVRSGASSTCSGGPAEVAEFARQVCEMRDAMLFIHGLVRDVRVWRDGSCPCGRCGGRGTDRGQPCDKCGGKGVR